MLSNQFQSEFLEKHARRVCNEKTLKEHEDPRTRTAVRERLRLCALVENAQDEIRSVILWIQRCCWPVGYG